MKTNHKDNNIDNQEIFDEYEKVFLTSLLVDPPQDMSKSLTADMLLSSPLPATEIMKIQSRKQLLDSNSRHRLKLWRAHQKGIKFLRRRAGEITSDTQAQEIEKNTLLERKSYSKHTSSMSVKDSNESECDLDDGPHSDSEVRPDKNIDEESSASSWNEEDLQKNFDSWQVLNDEYASDFGFDYNLNNVDLYDSDTTTKRFKIIGTSADDVKAYPHVLSPPLMESLLNFVPEALSAENFWLKYSLVRDGASLETLRNYCKASPDTVIAIQTTKGECFGCFTSSIWRVRNGYFGHGEPFIWRMRYNRSSPCYSLFEQARLESEIDVFPFSSLNKEVQLCTHNMIGIGGGELTDPSKSFYSRSQLLELGFAFVLHDDLLKGVTSPCPTFCSPRLTTDESGIFDVLNLEVWTFTPCNDVESAKTLEMRKFERMSNLSWGGITDSIMPTSPTSSTKDFYRRVGENEDEVEREAWALTSLNQELSNTISARTPKFIS
jgi:hypothetical protein